MDLKNLVDVVLIHFNISSGFNDWSNGCM